MTFLADCAGDETEKYRENDDEVREQASKNKISSRYDFQMVKEFGDDEIRKFFFPNFSRFFSPRKLPPFFSLLAEFELTITTIPEERTKIESK